MLSNVFVALTMRLVHPHKMQYCFCADPTRRTH